MSAFVVLSQEYHRNKFISIKQLSDQNNESLDLGILLLQSFQFLFDHSDLQSPLELNVL